MHVTAKLMVTTTLLAAVAAFVVTVPRSARVPNRAELHSETDTPHQDDRRRDARTHGRVSGRVVDPRGRPAAKAAVTVASAHSGARIARMYAGWDGSYNLAVPPGRYTVEATKMPWATMAYGQPDPEAAAAQVSVSAGERRHGIDIALGLGATVTGTILDGSGQPAVGAVVQLLRYDRTAAGSRLDVVSTIPPGRTDDRGYYRIFGIPSGRYMLAAVPPEGYQTVDAEAGNGYVRTFWPGAASDNDAKTITLDSSRESEVSLRLSRVPVIRLRGRVIDSSGARAEAGLVRLLRTDGGAPEAVGAATVAPDGVFSLEAAAPPGAYVLGALTGAPNRPGQTRDRELGRVAVRWSGSEPPLVIDIATAPGAIVKGRVVREGSEVPILPGTSVYPVPVDVSDSWLVTPSVKVESDGSFELRNVFVASRIATDCEPCADTSRTTYLSGRNVPDGIIQVSAAKVVDRVEIRLSPERSIATVDGVGRLPSPRQSSAPSR